MKKQLVIIGLVTILIGVGLSGCTEQSYTSNNEQVKTNSYSNYVQVYNVEVVTKTSYGMNERTRTGFYHGFPDDYTTKYVITGHVKNIGDKPINNVNLKMTFKDAPGNVITTKTSGVSRLYMGDSKSFEIRLSQHSEPFFEHITTYEIQITSVKFT